MVSQAKPGGHDDGEQLLVRKRTLEDITSSRGPMIPPTRVFFQCVLITII